MCIRLKQFIKYTSQDPGGENEMLGKLYIK